MKSCGVVLTFEPLDKIPLCDHSNETSSAVLSHGTIYLVCSSHFWVCGWNPMVLPFKWNLFSSTFTLHHLLSKFLPNEIWNFCFIWLRPLRTVEELTFITLNLNCHYGRTFPQHYKIKQDYKYVLHKKVRVCEPVTIEPFIRGKIRRVLHRTHLK